MVIVNVYKLVEEGIIQPIIEKIVEIEDRVEQVEKAEEMLDKKK